MLSGNRITWQFSSVQIIAVGIIIVTTILNLYKVAFSGLVQTILTIIKIGGLLILIGGVLFFSKNAHWGNFISPEGSVHWCGFQSFGATVIAALYAYIGWMALACVAGEVKNPERNIPLATILGTLLVILVFCAVNIAYFYALPIHEIATSNSALYPSADPVAGKVIQSFMSKGLSIVIIVFVIQIFGTMHSTVLVEPRILYAMADDKLFFTSFSSLSNLRVPAFAIVFNSVMACVLAVSGSYDILTTYYVFITQIMFVLVISSVFVLRHTIPDAPRPYRNTRLPYSSHHICDSQHFVGHKHVTFKSV